MTNKGANMPWYYNLFYGYKLAIAAGWASNKTYIKEYTEKHPGSVSQLFRKNRYFLNNGSSFSAEALSCILLHHLSGKDPQDVALFVKRVIGLSKKNISKSAEHSSKLVAILNALEGDEISKYEDIMLGIFDNTDIFGKLRQQAEDNPSLKTQLGKNKFLSSKYAGELGLAQQQEPVEQSQPEGEEAENLENQEKQKEPEVKEQQLEQQLQQQAATIEEKTKEIQKLAQQVEAKQAAIDSLTKETQKKETASKQQIDDLEQQVQQQATTIEEKAKEIQELTLQIGAKKAEIESLIKNTQGKETASKQQIDSLKQQVQQQLAIIGEKEEKITEQVARIKKLEKELEHEKSVKLVVLEEFNLPKPVKKELVANRNEEDKQEQERRSEEHRQAEERRQEEERRQAGEQQPAKQVQQPEKDQDIDGLFKNITKSELENFAKQQPQQFIKYLLDKQLLGSTVTAKQDYKTASESELNELAKKAKIKITEAEKKGNDEKRRVKKHYRGVNKQQQSKQQQRLKEFYDQHVRYLDLIFVAIESDTNAAHLLFADKQFYQLALEVLSDGIKESSDKKANGNVIDAEVSKKIQARQTQLIALCDLLKHGRSGLSAEQRKSNTPFSAVRTLTRIKLKEFLDFILAKGGTTYFEDLLQDKAVYPVVGMDWICKNYSAQLIELPNFAVNLAKKSISAAETILKRIPTLLTRAIAVIFKYFTDEVFIQGERQAQIAQKEQYFNTLKPHVSLEQLFEDQQAKEIITSATKLNTLVHQSLGTKPALPTRPQSSSASPPPTTFFVPLASSSSSTASIPPPPPMQKSSTEKDGSAKAGEVKTSNNPIPKLAPSSGSSRQQQSDPRQKLLDDIASGSSRLKKVKLQETSDRENLPAEKSGLFGILSGALNGRFNNANGKASDSGEEWTDDESDDWNDDAASTFAMSTTNRA
jgi:myosin heavy subunit